MRSSHGTRPPVARHICLGKLRQTVTIIGSRSKPESQNMQVPPPNRVHVLQLRIAERSRFVRLVFVEIEARDGVTDQDGEAGGYEYDDDNCAVGEVAVGCAVGVCAAAKEVVIWWHRMYVCWAGAGLYFDSLLGRYEMARL